MTECIVWDGSAGDGMYRASVRRGGLRRRSQLGLIDAIEAPPGSLTSFSVLFLRSFAPSHHLMISRGLALDRFEETVGVVELGGEVDKESETSDDVRVSIAMMSAYPSR